MKLELVMPAYNEQDRIDRTLSAYRSASMPLDLRILVALDSCSDGTAEVVARHAKEDPRIRCITFPKLGKGGVLREAFRQCTGDLVGFVDADGSTPPAEMARLAETAVTADAAIASRRHPASVTPAQRSLTRRVSSAVFSMLARRVFDLPFADTQCGAKVVRGDVMAALLPFLSARDFLFDVDVLVTARRMGFRIVEVPSIWIDRDGSKVRTSADACRMAAGCISLWLHHRLQPAPQRVVDLRSPSSTTGREADDTIVTKVGRAS